jgi:hypothetical protein
MIYVFGDSFSAWSNGWPNLIGAQTHGYRGSSEYRILKTYKQHFKTISSNDTVIFCHTHPSRVYLKDNNKELSSRLLRTHVFCDILFKDIYHKKEQKFIDTLETIWDDEYFRYMYDKIVQDCLRVNNSIHITFFNTIADKYPEMIDLSHIYCEHAGNRHHNHLTKLGNELVAQRINELLER